jgi:hypothetical protein
MEGMTEGRLNPLWVYQNITASQVEEHL